MLKLLFIVFNLYLLCWCCHCSKDYACHDPSHNAHHKRHPKFVIFGHGNTNGGMGNSLGEYK